MSTAPTLDAALDYAARGWHVFPLRPRSKAPATPHGFQDASRDPERITKFWEARPDANIGIATGRAGLIVLDVDPRHGGDDSLHELERRHRLLPVTPRATTGGGGEHVYMSTSRSIPCSAGKLGPGLDVKATGGYVVAPGSIHESGQPYAWDIAPEEARLALVPDWLLTMLEPDPQGRRTRQPATTWQKLAGGVGEGQRNDAVARLYGYLLARRVEPILAASLVVNWDRSNRPPLGREEVLAVIRSIARRELRKGSRRGN